MKKLLSLAISLVFVLALAVPGMAAEILPRRWEDVSIIENTFKVTKRTGSISVNVALSSNNDCSVLVELQRYINGDWDTLEDWPLEGQSGCGLTAKRALYPGYQYRVYLTIEVTDHETGELIERIYSESRNQPFVE